MKGIIMWYVLLLWLVCLAIGYVLIRSRFPPDPTIRINPPRRKRMA